MENNNDNVEIKIDDIVEDTEENTDDIAGENFDTADISEEEKEQDTDNAEPIIEEAPKPKTELEQAEELANEYKNIAQRVQAEFENYKKRNADVFQRAYEDGKIDVINGVLPVIDNLERALGSMVAGKDKDGVALILKQLNDYLKSIGVVEIEASGKAFDPKVHNAVMKEEKDGIEEGQVLEVFQKGYRTKNKVIRHSLVKVSG